MIKANNQKGIEKAQTLVDLSNLLVYSKTPDALEFAKNAYEIAEDLGNDSVKYAALKAMGYANGYLGYFEVSLDNMRTGLKYYEKIGDSVKIAEALSDIGYLLQALSSSEANIMEYNQKSLAIREKIGDEKGIAYSLNNIGALYWQWKKYDEAIDYFLRAIPYFERLGLDEEIATTTSNIGAYYVEKEEEQKATVFLNRALELYRKLNHKNGEAIILGIMAKSYLQNGDTQNAMKYNLMSRQLRLEIGDKKGLVENYYNIGYLKMIDGNLNGALADIEQSLKLAREIGLKHKQIEILETLSEINHKLNHNGIAFNLLKESKILNDSVFNAEKHRQLEEIRTKYDVDKKELENSQLKAQNESQKLILQKNRFILMLSLSVALLVILFVLLYNERRKTNLKYNALESEQRLLRSQMNPHFIFNAITTIQSFIFSHSPKEASRYLSAFASLMRQILESSKSEFIVIDDELKMLTNYFLLQQLRYPNKFNYRINVDDTIDRESTLIPPMLNQPLIENAIEHGLKSVDYLGEINIAYSLNNKSVMVEISDNGIGILKGKSRIDSSHKSFALESIKKRLTIIHKTKSKNFILEVIDKNTIDPQQTGTIVTYSIPFIQKY